MTSYVAFISLIGEILLAYGKVVVSFKVGSYVPVLGEVRVLVRSTEAG